MIKHTLSLIAVGSALVISSFTLYREAAAPTYKVDAAKSTLKWTAKKVTGEHTGNVKISAGSLVVDKNTIQSGSFDLDMTSITCTDLTDAGTNAKLIGHLKSDDFFS